MEGDESTAGKRNRTPTSDAGVAGAGGSPQSSQPPPLLSTVSPDTVLHILGYLDHRTLGSSIQPTSKALHHYADLDTIWRPITRSFLKGRTCLKQKDIDSELSSTESNPISRGVSRVTLKAAVLDSKRRVLTKDEICSLRFNMRILNMPSIPAMHQQLPDDIPPVYVQFNRDWSCQTEGERPGSSHELFDWHSRWEMVEPAMQSLVPVDGGRSFRLPELRDPLNNEETELLQKMGQQERAMYLMERDDFTCFHWYGRPPLKLWRHPTNWSVCLTHINYQYSSQKLPPLGSDPVFDNDEPYIHPWNFMRGALGGGGPRPAHPISSSSSDDDQPPSDNELD